MATKELQDHRLPGDIRDREDVAVVIESREISQLLTHLYRVVGDPLWADVHEGAEEGTSHCGEGRGVSCAGNLHLLYVELRSAAGTLARDRCRKRAPPTSPSAVGGVSFGGVKKG